MRMNPFVVTLCLALTGCREQPVVGGPVVPDAVPGQEAQHMTAVPYRLIEVRANGGLRSPERTLLTDSRAFLAAWQRAHAGTDPGVVLPQIDPTRETAVLVALGERPNGGYGIRVSAVESNAAGVVVHVESQRPGPDCMTTAALTQPYEFVAIQWRGQAGQVRFVEHERVDDCR